MPMKIDDKLEELFQLLDELEDIKKMKNLKNKISDKELKLIENYRYNKTLENKKKLYDNKIINDYLISESNINYLIMQINQKFRRSKSCESNKW